MINVVYSVCTCSLREFLFFSDSFCVCVQTYQRSRLCFCLSIVASAPFAFRLIEIKALFPEALYVSFIFFFCVCVRACVLAFGHNMLCLTVETERDIKWQR